MDRNDDIDFSRVQQGVALGNSDKRRVVAGVLAIVVGWTGAHNFYLGGTRRAVTQLLVSALSIGLLSWVSGLWGLGEGVCILRSKTGDDWHRDAVGRELRG